MSQAHTTTNCPQRSMAWITVDENNQIIGATKEMKQLLDYDPTDQYLDGVWKEVESDQSYRIVETLHSLRTLCICEHAELEKRILICTDITDLNHMYTKRHNNISITRLTMYGTIEAAFQSQTTSSVLSVGQPMMRYIHSDDVQEFCSCLNEASKSLSIVSVDLRLLESEEEEEEKYQWSEFTVMTIQGGRKILCLIKPSTLTTKTATSGANTAVMAVQPCGNVLQETVTQMQTKFWYAIEHGMTLAAHSLATSLVLIIQTVWQLWCDKSHNNKSWTGLFATSSEYVLRKVAKCAKDRPEIKTLCRLVSWTGISQNTAKSFIDNTLDQTTEWLIYKTQSDTSDGVDIII